MLEFGRVWQSLDPQRTATFQATRKFKLVARSDLADFESDASDGTSELPDRTLTVSIPENHASVGDTRQVSSIFQMSRTDTRSGRGVWEGEETITKQGQKNTVGS